MEQERILILGAAISGIGAAVLAKKNKVEVMVSDAGIIAEKYKQVLLQHEISWEESSHELAKSWQPTLVIKSPGIPDKVAIVQHFLQKGIDVISEIEYGSICTATPIVGITGSNGKTTTTMLAHHLIQQGGIKAGLGGNIGLSFAQLIAESQPDWFVLEISSFQLDGIVSFRPRVAIITNITPDHLDRYDYKFQNYVASKFRIVMNQTHEDYLIYDADDPTITAWLENNPIKSQLYPFSLLQTLERGAYLKDKTIELIIDQNTKLSMSTDYLSLEGKHNVKNTMAASLAAMLVGIRKETIRQSVASFSGVPHRLEKVLKINHVHYINDSKATNVNATYFALDGIHKPIIWIAGGVDKGNDYTELLPLVREKVKAIICLGIDNQKLFETFGNVIEPMVETFSMEEAVKVAYKLAHRGDTVLLSPACASFDLFKNFEDRGDQFKEQIRKL